MDQVEWVRVGRTEAAAGEHPRSERTDQELRPQDTRAGGGTVSGDQAAATGAECWTTGCVPHLPTIGISGEFILATMPLGLLVDHFFQKGEYTPGQLNAKMKELIADSPIRPHIGKADRAPLWIPRKDAEYIVLTCPECLRSSSIANEMETGDLQQTECLACGACITYLVDSSVLKVLKDKKLALPAESWS